jgi:Bacterial PH domain
VFVSSTEQTPNGNSTSPTREAPVDHNARFVEPGPSEPRSPENVQRTATDAGIRLQEGEEVILALRRTCWYATACKIFTLGLYVPWWSAACFVVTDRRLITKKGILNTQEHSVPLQLIQDATVERTPDGIGRVSISTAGDSAGLSRIDLLKPRDARQLADTTMSQALRLIADCRPSPPGTDDTTEPPGSSQATA